MKLSKKLVVAALALPLGFAGVSAFAAQEEGTAAQFAEAKINIFQAIHAAEKHHPGRAMSAEFEMMDGKGVYKVDVLNKRKETMEIMVDAHNGKVLSAKADTDEGGAQQAPKN
jgi:uncharacterized membrane protein YkoI